MDPTATAVATEPAALSRKVDETASIAALADDEVEDLYIKGNG